MKPKALYHLLLDRARHMRVHDIAEVSNFIDSIEDSIDIDFAHGIYTIKWAYEGKNHATDVKHTDFKFYIRGDLGKPPSMRDIRRGNWDAALDMWRKMASISGHEWSAEIENHQEAMGLKLGETKNPLKEFIQNYAVLAVVLSISGTLLGGFEYGLSAMLSGTALAYLSRARDGLRRAPWPQLVNDWMIGLSALLLPHFFGVQEWIILSAIMALIALYNAIELYRPFNKIIWITALVTLAVVSSQTHSPALSWGIELFALLWLVCAIVIPGRYARLVVIIGLAIIMIENVLGLFSTYSSSDIPPFIWPVVIISALMCALGWFIGEMPSLSPWLIHGLIGFMGVGVLITGDANVGASLSVALGFVIVEALRLLTAFRGTKATPIILPDGVK